MGWFAHVGLNLGSWIGFSLLFPRWWLQLQDWISSCRSSSSCESRCVSGWAWAWSQPCLRYAVPNLFPVFWLVIASWISTWWMGLTRQALLIASIGDRGAEKGVLDVRVQRSIDVAMKRKTVSSRRDLARVLWKIPRNGRAGGPCSLFPIVVVGGVRMSPFTLLIAGKDGVLYTVLYTMF